MQETLRALLGLQDIDRHIFKVENELRRLPKELEKRQAQLAQKVARNEELKKAALELRTSIKEIEDITTQQRQRQRKLEGEIQKTSDGALIAAYQHEIRTLKKTISQAEEDGLGLLERVDAMDKEVAEIEGQLTQERAEFAEYESNIQKETAEAEGRLADLKSQLQTLSSESVTPQHLALYKGLLRSREGEAMAELDGRFCQGCFVEIPKNLAVRLARGVELVQCISCDRILYIRD